MERCEGVLAPGAYVGSVDPFGDRDDSQVRNDLPPDVEHWRTAQQVA
jgi:hypothetical protein